MPARKTSPPQLIKNISAHLTTLVLSAVIAIVIWVVAIQESDPPNNQLWQVPITVMGVPPDGRLLNQPVETIQLLVQAPTSIMGDLSLTDFLAFIDLSQVPFGTQELPIQVETSRDYVQIISWIPQKMTVELERIISRQIPVTVNIRGSVSAGFQAGTPFLEPTSITVTGPDSRVNSLNEARITVFLDNTRQTFVASLRPVYYDMQGSVVGTSALSVSADLVQVTVPVEELEGFAQKPITVNWVGMPAPGYRLLNVTVEPSSVLVTGRPIQLDNLTRLQTETIDISGLKESFTQEVTLDLPNGITLDAQQAVFVTIEIEPILTSAVVSRLPELRALGEGLTATIDVDEVRVFLYGPLETIDSLAEEDVRVTLDLVGRDVGSHLIRPTVAISAEELELRSIQPTMITVVITDLLTTTTPLTDTQSFLPLPTLLLGAEETNMGDHLPVQNFTPFYYYHRRFVIYRLLA